MRCIAILFLFILLHLSADAQEFIPLHRDSVLKRVDELKALVDEKYWLLHDTHHGKIRHGV